MVLHANCLRRGFTGAPMSTIPDSSLPGRCPCERASAPPRHGAGHAPLIRGAELSSADLNMWHGRELGSIGAARAAGRGLCAPVQAAADLGGLREPQLSAGQVQPGGLQDWPRAEQAHQHWVGPWLALHVFRSVWQSRVERSAGSGGLQCLHPPACWVSGRVSLPPREVHDGFAEVAVMTTACTGAQPGALLQMYICCRCTCSAVCKLSCCWWLTGKPRPCRWTQHLQPSRCSLWRLPLPSSACSARPGLALHPHLPR